MDLSETYEAITVLQEELKLKLEEEMRIERNAPKGFTVFPDNKTIQALAATFVLQEYIANEISDAMRRDHEVEKLILSAAPEEEASNIEIWRSIADDFRKRAGKKGLQED